MFRQFDIDYDKVTIDGSILYKPSYIDSSKWFGFWDQFDGVSVKEKVEKSFNKGYRCRQDEQDKEIEQVKDLCSSDLKVLSKKIKNLIDDPDFSTYDTLTALIDDVESIRDQIWQL